MAKLNSVWFQIIREMVNTIRLIQQEPEVSFSVSSLTLQRLLSSLTLDLADEEIFEQVAVHIRHVPAVAFQQLQVNIYK